MNQRRLWRALALTSMLVIAVEMMLSSRSLYGRMLEPKSYANRVTEVLVGGRLFASEHARASRAAVLGDSRMAEGFSAKVANECSPSQVRWFSAAVAGSTPRIWSFLLQRLADDGCKFDWVVVPLQSYAAASVEHRANRTLDAQCMVPLSNPWRAVRFGLSFEDSRLRLPMFLKAAVPSIGLREDVLAFLRDPAGRVRRLSRPGALYRSMDNYRGRDSDLEPVIDWDGSRHVFAAGMDAGLRKELELARRRVPTAKDVAAETAYLRRWMGSLSSACESMGATLVVLRAPRGPLGKEYALEDAAGVRSLLGLSPKVVVLPAETFAHLEVPSHFFDHVHMNAKGRRAFTDRLARELGTLRGEAR